MSYSAEDLAAVRQAILTLGQGQRVAQVRSANGTTLTYQAADLPTLKSIEKDIQASLAAASSTVKRSRSMNVLTSKGL